ncbi:MAG: MBL fold metallo-hydrolase [Actinomycetota bacterium]
MSFRRHPRQSTSRRRAIPAAALTLSLVATGIAAADSGDPLVVARARIFGIENVDATGNVRSDRVILSWFGVSNFAMAIGGHVVLLDAWIPKGEYSGYVPISPQELAALSPEAIFVGHSHFDHLADAGLIIEASDPVIVGTPEHCAAARSFTEHPVRCEEIATSSPGDMAEISTLGPDVDITVVRHVHSGAKPADTTDPHAPLLPPTDPGAVLNHPPSPADSLHTLSHLPDPEGGSLLYQFRIGNFSLTWHDSTGPLKEDAPEVFNTLRALPPTDVELSAIMGFDQFTNGLRDPRMYTEALEPKLLVPEHHDNWAPPVTSRGENYRPALEAELAKIPADSRPALRFISDPQDYVRPEVLTFEVGNAAWD